MRQWNSQHRAGVMRRALAIVVLQTMFSSALSDGADEPVPSAIVASEGLRPGAIVVLKAPGVPLFDQGNMVSGQDYLTFVVDRVEAGRLSVSSHDKRCRGSLHVEQVVPIDQALEFFSDVISHDARNADAYWMRGRLYLYHQDADRALANLNQAARLAPAKAHYYLTRSVVFMRRQQFEEALEDCNRVIAIEPNDARAYVARAKARLARNEVEKAHADLELSFRVDPTNPTGPISTTLKWKHTPKAASMQALAVVAGPFVKTASESIAARLEPKNAAEYVSRGNLSFEKQDYTRAIADFDAAIETDRSCAAAYAARARAWTKKHYRERENADWTAAINLEPGNAAFRVARAESWSGLGKHERAMTDYADALRIEPENPTIWVSRGNEWRKDLKLDLAIADFNQAIRLDSKYAPAYVARANAWKQIQRFDLAIEGFSELIRIDPDNAVAHQTLARILATCHEDRFRNGRLALNEAIRACEITHWRSPDSLDTLAAAYAELGEFPSAVKWQTEAIKLIRQNVYSELYQKAQSMSGGAAPESASKTAWRSTRAVSGCGSDRRRGTRLAILLERIAQIAFDKHLQTAVDVEADRFALGDRFGCTPLVGPGLLKQDESDGPRASAAMHEHLARALGVLFNEVTHGGDSILG